MASSSQYLLGLVLVLIAMCYQYREEIRVALVGPTEKEPLQGRGRGGGGSGGTRGPTPVSQGTKSKPQTTDEQINSQATETVEEDTDTTVTNSLPSPSPDNPPFDPNNPTELYSKSGSRLITVNELAAHGHSGPLKPIWLAMLGRVYDVDKGAERYYGPNGGYNFFTGRDGTRAFVTGEFDENGLTDDIESLSPLQIGELDSWLKFYDKEYTYVGKLIGRYYAKDGSPKKAWYKFQKLLGEQEKMKAEQRKLEQRYPGCNSKWNEKDGGIVYCSDKRSVILYSLFALE